MKVMVVNNEDYIKFNARLSNEMKVFELKDNTTNYIIHRVKLGNGIQDISLLDSCIDAILDNQYYKKEYITIEDIRKINDLIIGLNKEECQILNAYAEVKRYNIKDLNEIKKLIENIKDYQIIPAYDLRELGLLIAQKVPDYHINDEVIPFVDFSKLAETYLFDARIEENFCSYGLLVNTKNMLANELVDNIDKNKKFKIDAVNKQEFEETGKTHKPKCALIGQDGNIFNLMGIASRTLKKNGLREQADEMVNRITNSHSYYEALNIISDYVDVTDGEYKGDEEYEDDFENEYEEEME